MLIQITHKLTLTDCPQDLRAEICGRLTFTNPKWTENEKMGRWQGQTPKLIRVYENSTDGALIVPLGFANQMVGCFRAFGGSPLAGALLVKEGATGSKFRGALLISRKFWFICCDEAPVTMGLINDKKGR
jgi:hypothetical protein